MARQAWARQKRTKAGWLGKMARQAWARQGRAGGPKEGKRDRRRGHRQRAQRARRGGKGQGEAPVRTAPKGWRWQEEEKGAKAKKAPWLGGKAGRDGLWIGTYRRSRQWLLYDPRAPSPSPRALRDRGEPPTSRPAALPLYLDQMGQRRRKPQAQTVRLGTRRGKPPREGRRRKERGKERRSETLEGRSGSGPCGWRCRG